jgi:formylglycine-generating enzyme required for sulfatase activity
MVNGVDATPATEPQPLVTVDRLLFLRLQPGVVGQVRVLMTGECAGTMALLSQTPPYQTPRIDQAATCVDQENMLSLLTPEALEPDTSLPTTSQLGTFGAGEPCQPGGSSSPTSCVPSGVFIMGDPRVIDMGPTYAGVPERVVAMDRFWIDRNEVTVGQLRSSVKAGFYRGRALPVGVHDAPLGVSATMDTYSLDKWCTWSTMPMGRENDPLSCVTWEFARDYCTFQGGTLTTEAQWEYAASAADRSFKTMYPWGSAQPTCEQVLFDRESLDSHTAHCSKDGKGPFPVTSTPFDSTPNGVLNMAGSQAEIMLDNLEAYSAPCWLASIHNPSCVDPSTSLHALRGGSWALPEAYLLTAMRSDASLQTIRAIYGFRCAYGAPPSP